MFVDNRSVSQGRAEVAYRPGCGTVQRWCRGVCQFQQEGQGITHQVVRNRAGDGGHITSSM